MKPNASKTPAPRSSFGQPAWRLSSPCIEAYVTENGGHLGPVTFTVGEKKIQPYSVAPWVQEKSKESLPPMLQVLRGDFFCLPFGGNGKPFRGEQHPPHGETANARWTCEGWTRQGERQCLHLSLATHARAGRVDKRISLVDGQTVTYSQHIISGMSGPMNLGHHAMLRFPDVPGSGIISVSPFVYGQVFPEAFEQPENRGYSALQPGAEFDSLERVPTRTQETTDLTRYPARRGFEDLVLMVSDATRPFAWTAVAFPKERYVWFALKNPQILRETIFWISNGGRHYPPWSGRHVNVMGLEEVTSYFHLGLAEAARPNPLTAKGFPTCLQLSAKKPCVVPYITGVASIPPGFDRVSAIEAGAHSSEIIIQATSGKASRAAVNLDFLHQTSPWE